MLVFCERLWQEARVSKRNQPEFIARRPVSRVIKAGENLGQGESCTQSEEE